MYTVIGPVQTRTFRVLWMLEELGQPYTHRPDPPRSAAVRAVSPAGKVPVLLDGEAALTESVAILSYLADRHGRLAAPPGSLERARQDGLTHHVLDVFDAVLWAAARHAFVLPEAQRVPAVRASLRWEFAQSAEAMAAQLGEGPFLAGAALSLPDIVLGHCLGWSIKARFDPLPEALSAYLARLQARPAYRAALARV